MTRNHWHATKLLGAVLGGALILWAADARAEGPGAPSRLKCEYQVDPIGIDAARPRLYWQVEDARRGTLQTAYQVLVASTKELLAQDRGDFWDSGRVESDQSAHVVYGGQPLESRQRCCWKVRTWDAAGKPSPWSEPARWEMALLVPGDWKAKWIEPAEFSLNEKPIPLSDWFWHPDAAGDNTTVYFRTEINYPEDGPSPHHAKLAITADDRYEVFVNGARVAADGNFHEAEWHILWARTNLHRGRNVIAVKATNAIGPAGLATGVRQTYYGGRIVEFQPTDWICSTEQAKGWEKPDFKPSGWVKAKKVGKMGDKPWGSIAQNFDGPRRSSLLRKEFTLPADPVAARVYVTGLGFYRLELNGRRVGHDEFTPGWTLYGKRQQYQVYDVTDLLNKGENAVGAILGNGWWSGGLGWAGGQARFSKPGENLRLLCQLEVECRDGSRHVVASDGSWTSHFSPILEDTLYHGETYDARLEQPGWSRPGFRPKKADAWKSAKPVEPSPVVMNVQYAPPLRVTEQLKPVRITEPKPGVYVLDFGQNHAGRPLLKIKAPAGTKITIHHAEILGADGLIDNVNYRSARVTDTYIAKGQGVETWEPIFTYRGFRYMQVTGLPQKPGPETIVSQVMHTACPPSGRFACSDELVNQVVKNVLWGQRSNLYSVPTDCPQRDERLGWTGDAEAFAPTSFWNMDMAAFFTKWMRDVADSQQPDGATTGVAPIIVLTPDSAGRAAWADVVSIVPWRVYEYYGDRRILEENYPAVKAWVEYIRRNLNEDGLYEKPTWGDWVPVVTTPDRPISACYGIYSTKLLADMARVLGKKDDEAQYTRLADAQTEAFNRKHLHRDTMNYITGTQASNVLPLAFGIVQPADVQAVADNVANSVIEHGYHHTTGFLGSPVILPVLADHGHPELAWRIISSDEYPSLGYMVKKGATTIWERWNTDQTGPEMNSRNHFALGSMVQWLFEGVAGVRFDPQRPGFKHVIVRPYPVGDLTWAKVEYPSLYGRIASAWKIEDGQFRLHVEIPANSSATVFLPVGDASKATEGGKPLSRAEGVTARPVEGGRLPVEVSAGTYDFACPRPPAVRSPE